jgi:phosphoserine aminotransferase
MPTDRSVFNFSAGPGCLPESVLRQAQKDLWNLRESGIGILEHSHRGRVFDRLLEETIAVIREVGSVPDTHDVFFMQGGATSQCYFVPANLLAPDRTADYFQTGKWANDSIKEAPLYGTCHICGTSKPTLYDRIPTPAETRYSASPAYVHFTSNNTIMGTEFATEPTPPAGAYLVCDASSDIYSKPIDVSRYGLIYAGAQKNLGPSGVTVLWGRKDIVRAEPVRKLPEMMRFKNHAENEGRFNTPPTFAIYLVGEVCKWVRAEGGLAAMAERNREKAGVIYDFLDSQDFYRPHAQKTSRSLMNITFKCPTEELDDLFVAEAEKKGLDGLRGHRMIGGMRASIYNAFPKAGCVALVEFMKSFARTHAGASARA